MGTHKIKLNFRQYDKAVQKHELRIQEITKIEEESHVKNLFPTPPDGPIPPSTTTSAHINSIILGDYIPKLTDYYNNIISFIDDQCLLTHAKISSNPESEQEDLLKKYDVWIKMMDKRVTNIVNGMNYFERISKENNHNTQSGNDNGLNNPTMGTSTLITHDDLATEQLCASIFSN